HSTMLYNICADPETAHGQVSIASGALSPEAGSSGNVIGRTYAGAEVYFTGEPEEGYGLRSIEIVNAIGGVLPQDPVFTMPFGTVTVRGYFDTFQTLSFEGDEHARFTNIWQDDGGMPVWEDVYEREVICGQLIQMNWECDEDWTADTITVTTAGGDSVDWTFGWDQDDRKVIRFVMPGENVHVTLTSRAFSFDNADFILPADTRSIEANAFQGDTYITAVVIPGLCESIGQEAFRNCTNLRYILIPANCTVGEDAFEGCDWVYIYGSENSSAWQYCQDHDNCTFVEE
ncbi:MAG: leucine-rich repeat domain-containing protein, partial [Clostridium sp.]|nr:leucine-rich repeat domain-containing protein [Clostridium sp.]